MSVRPSAPTPSFRIDSVQYLRFFAAFIVLFGHVMMMMHEAALIPDATYRSIDLVPWGSGVDIFFIISGFIIAHVVRHQPRGLKAGVSFSLRRLIRVAPVYWFYTALFFAAAIAIPRGGGIPPLADLLRSLLFVPFVPAGEELVRPILGQGWTLNYEMFFYAIVAACILFGVRRIKIVASAAIVLFVVANSLFGSATVLSSFLSNTVLLEFIGGMVAYHLFVRGYRLNLGSAVALVVLGLTGFILGNMVLSPYWTPAFDMNYRFLYRGLPSLALFAGVVMSKDLNDTVRSSRLFILLGDASYSLYLSHPFVIVPSIMIFKGSSLPWPVLATMIIAAAIVVSIISYLTIERFFIHLSHKLTETKRVSTAAVGTIASLPTR